MQIGLWVIFGSGLILFVFWANSKVSKSFKLSSNVSKIALGFILIVIVIQMLYTFNGIADPNLNTDNKMAFTLESILGLVTLLGLYHVLEQNRISNSRSKTNIEIKKLKNTIVQLQAEINCCPERAKHNENLYLVKKETNR